MGNPWFGWDGWARTNPPETLPRFVVARQLAAEPHELLAGGRPLDGVKAFGMIDGRTSLMELTEW